jgi:hypothetical protein
MTQANLGTIIAGSKSGNSLASDLTNFEDALLSNHSGASRPSYASTGTVWVDSSSSNLIFYVYNGSVDIPFMQLDASNNVARMLMDNDRDSYIVSDTDDVIRVVVSGSEVARFNADGLQVNGDTIRGIAGSTEIAAQTPGHLIDASNFEAMMLSAMNVVQVHHADPETYTAASDVHLSQMDVVITPSDTTSRVELDVTLSIEANVAAPGVVLYMERNGTEFASAATAGSRLSGHVSMPFDGDTASSMATVSFKYIDSPGTTSPVTYSFHVRMSASAVVSLNRTLNDTDSAIHERATSTVIAREIGA